MEDFFIVQCKNECTRFVVLSHDLVELNSWIFLNRYIIIIINRYIIILLLPKGAYVHFPLAVKTQDVPAASLFLQLKKYLGSSRRGAVVNESD